MPRHAKDADALRYYLDELSRVRALSREEELSIARVVRDAQETLREVVLSHPPSLRRLADLLGRVASGELAAVALAADPYATGDTAEQVRQRLVEAGPRLAALVGAPVAAGSAGGGPDAATALARELPLDRGVLLELFEEAWRAPPNGSDDAVADDDRWRRAREILANAERAKRKLAEHNLRLVVTLARRHTGRGLPLDDLIQEGNLGLLRAIDGFDPGRGFRLGTYAAWWIRKSMQHALAEQTRTIRVPRHVAEAASAVGRYARGFQHEAGRAPTADEIASGLGVPLARVNAAIELGPDAVSLESPLGTDDSLELGDVIADREAPSPDDLLLVKDFAARTREALDGLTLEEREVVSLRFGIGVTGPHTVEEVAALRGLGTERVRQLEARALRKLRHAKRTRLLRAYARG